MTLEGTAGVRSRLAVGRVVVYKSKRVEKTGGPLSLSTFLEPRFKGHSSEISIPFFTYMDRPRDECELVRVL
jgi:hypothetical protein